MQKRKAGIVKTMTQGILALFKAAGVTPLQGHGKLLSGRRVEFTAHDGTRRELTAKNIILASRLRVRSSCARRRSMAAHRRFLGRARIHVRAEATRRHRRRCHRSRAR